MFFIAKVCLIYIPYAQIPRYAGRKRAFCGETFEAADDFIRRPREYTDCRKYERIVLRLKGLSPVEYRTQSRMMRFDFCPDFGGRFVYKRRIRF